MENITYERLPLEKLKIASYQVARLNLARAKKIAKEYDVSKVGVITVSFREGTYYVVDGQHRFVATRLAGHKDIMAMVITGLTYEEEAIRFAKQSENQKGVEVAHKFYALLEAKDSQTLRMNEIVKSAGLELSVKKHKMLNQIIAISTVQIIFKQSGESMLFSVCKLIKDTWEGIPESLSREILNGVHLFLKHYSNIIIDTIFVSQLKKVEPTVIIREGNSDISLNSAIKYSKAIWNRYNKGLTEKYKLPNRF